MVMKGEQFPADLVLLASSSRWILRISTRLGYAVLLNMRRIYAHQSDICGICGRCASADVFAWPTLISTFHMIKLNF